jgi:hypothetical protein
MLPLGRFKALARSYGARLERWPEELRAEAQALVTVSREARIALDAERRLDEAIGAGSAHEEAVRWMPHEQEAALARVRAGVASRIDAAARRRDRNRFRDWLARRIDGMPWRHLRSAGLAAAGGFAVMAGLTIGGMYMPAPPADSGLTMFDPAPIHILAD